MTQNAENNELRAPIALRNVRKTFGNVEVIHGLDLEIEGGEFVVFVGPSGCGKSTLLRMIAGLEDVSEGDVHIAGREVTNLDPAKRGIAMVFQSYALYPHMNVKQNMAYGLTISRTPKAEIESRVASAAEILKITPLLDRRPRQLSGGQRQRVAIGRAIVRKPQVFLFDEPLSNLDAELRVSMRIEIARLHEELGNTMIYVTHDQTEAMTLADKIVVLRNGHIEQVGTPHQVYEDPNNEFVAGFIGSPRMNILSTKVEADGRIGVEGGHVAANVEAAPKPGETVKFGIRPEHLTLAEKSETTLTAKVDYAEYLGSNGYLYCTTQSGQALIAEVRDMDPPSAGELVHFAFDPKNIRLFAADGARLR